MARRLRDLFEKPDQWSLETGPRRRCALFRRLGWEVAALLLPAFVMFMRVRHRRVGRPESADPWFSSAFARSCRAYRHQRAGRLFSVPGLVEFGKSLFKVVVVGIVVFFVMRSEYFGALDAMYLRSAAIFAKIGGAMKKLRSSSSLRHRDGCRRRPFLDAASLVHRAEDDASRR